MKQSNRYELRDRVLTKEDIIRLGQKIYDFYEKDFTEFKIEYLKSEKQKYLTVSEAYRGRFKITLSCSDGSSYSSNDVNSLTDQDILDRKKVNSIDISFDSAEYNNSISLEVTEGENIYSKSYLIVTGNEAMWVNGVGNEILDIFNHAKPQENFILNHKSLITIFTGILLSILTVLTILFLLSFIVAFLIKIQALQLNTPKSNDDSWKISLFILTLSFTLPWKIWLDGKIKDFWPSIEFDFGPKHYQKSKIKRKVFKVFITLFLIPLLFFILGKVF